MAFLQFVCVLVLLLSGNAVAAGTIWVLGTLANVSGMGEAPFVLDLIAITGVAAGIGWLYAVMRFIGRLPRNRGRAPG